MLPPPTAPALPRTLSDLPPLRECINAAGLRADKKFGQNFLLDLNITRKIVRLARLPTGARVLEIGPGPGGLTRALLEAGAHVMAFELDSRVKPILLDLQMASAGQLDILFKDALAVDWASYAGAHIVANLPYNIATPLLFQWLDIVHKNPNSLPSITVMVQEEVAQRICAQPDSKIYGRLSVMTQWIMDVEAVMTLPPSAFTPPPKINSTIIRMTPKSQDDIDFKAMERIVADAFNQRRKMIRTSLGSYNFCWEKLGIDPQKRAENLTVDNYKILANASMT